MVAIRKEAVAQIKKTLDRYHDGGDGCGAASLEFIQMQGKAGFTAQRNLMELHDRFIALAKSTKAMVEIPGDVAQLCKSTAEAIGIAQQSAYIRGLLESASDKDKGQADGFAMKFQPVRRSLNLVVSRMEQIAK